MATESDDYYHINYTAIGQSGIFTIALASVSLLFPLSVVFILIQRYETLVRGKSLIHYILMIAIADTMVALFIAFGYPPSGSIACSVQGFGKNFFARMSWFFTDVLILQLFYLVIFKKYFLDKRYMHVIVFVTNIVLALIPFITGTIYGQDDDDKGIPLGSCSTSNGTSTYREAYLWVTYTINIELYISFIFIVILSTIVVVYSLTFKNSKSSNIYINERIRSSWKVIILYPLAMLVAWVPGTAYALYFNTYTNNSGNPPSNGIIIANYLQALNVLYGPLLSLIFYTKTVDARRAWMYNLRCILYLIMDIDIDDRSTCSSIISIEDVRVSDKIPSKLSRLFSWNRNSALASSIINADHHINPMSNETIMRIEESL